VGIVQSNLSTPSDRQRVGDVEGAKVRLACPASAETADRITAAPSERYFEHGAIVVSPKHVSVVSGEEWL